MSFLSCTIIQWTNYVFSLFCKADKLLLISHKQFLNSYTHMCDGDSGFLFLSIFLDCLKIIKCNTHLLYMTKKHGLIGDHYREKSYKN
jgi:hypothetical protein